MATIKEKLIALAQRQVGYKETGTNHTKYSNYFDTTAWQWFNTKKQGAAWCAIFVCWLFCQNEILGPKKARTFLGCPKPADNCAAGVPYFWGYLTKKGYKVDKTKGQAGDIIFFNAKCTHVGIIEKVVGSTYHTIEGNKSNMVKRCTYSNTSSSIYGVCRPNWAAVEPKTTSEPAPTPEPAPVPTPAPTPTYPKYKVKTKTGDWLALRVAPNTRSVMIYRMNQGSEVELINTVKGEEVYGSNEWARVKYLKTGSIGYCIKSRLAKV